MTDERQAKLLRAHLRLPSAFCLLPTAFRLPPSAYCFCDPIFKHEFGREVFELQKVFSAAVERGLRDEADDL